jgi:Fe(II)/alpha-ketoglutarate-dependent arginine beta-hydroxylase
MQSTLPTLIDHIFTLGEKQAEQISHFAKKYALNPFTNDQVFERFITQSFLLVKALPVDVIAALLELRRGLNDDGVLLIRGLPVEDSRVGPTPLHWSRQAQAKGYYDTEMYLAGIASVLGEIFTLSAQHDGNVIQNIVPIAQDTYEQMGTGSRVFLEWHTEDAFHDWCADFLGLLCLRADADSATTFACVKQMHLPENYKRRLFEKKFQAGVDKAHGGSEQPEEGQLISVLSGRYEDPFIRIDTDCIQAGRQEPEAQQALQHLLNEIPLAARQVVLQKGDLLFLDNRRVVHGRTAFTPRFDGTDRWLQRVSITADFQKSYPGRTRHFRVIEMDGASGDV